MTIGNFFAVLRRRWLLVILGFLLTGGLSGGAYFLVKPTYEITGTILFLPPKSSLVTGSPNPYLQLGGLEQAVDLVGVGLSDQATQLEMREISKNVEYTAKQDATSTSPLLVVDVKDTSPDTAKRIRDILMSRAPERLRTMQDTLSVGSNDRVTTTIVTNDVEAQEVGRNRLRAAVVAACLGLALTLVTATVWDAYRLRRPRARRTLRRQSRVGQTESSPDSDPGDSEELTLPTAAESPPLSDEFDSLQDHVDASGPH